MDIWILLGVIFWGFGCVVLNVFGIYIEIYKFFDWIGNIINNELLMVQRIVYNVYSFIIMLCIYLYFVQIFYDYFNVYI